MEIFSADKSVSLSPLGEELANKIRLKSNVVGVVGLGYVGLPIALEYAKKGIRTLGVDVSKDKVDLLQGGKNYIEDLQDDEVAVAVENGLLKASTDFSIFIGCRYHFYLCTNAFQ